MEVLTFLIIMVLGFVLGSFYCCIGLRIPNKISIINPPSHCPKCKKKLKWYMNIPVLSYLILGGKCAYCKKQISLLYPFIEMFTAILFVISFVKYGFSLEFFLLIILCSVLVITIVSDFLYYYISDRVVIIGLILIFLVNFIYNGTSGLITSLISSLVMFLIMLMVKVLGDKIFKKESLGGGDIKLMALIGASNGIIPSVCGIIVSSMIALPFALFVTKKDKDIIPFGPFLLLGGVIFLFFKSPINNFLGFLGW